MGRFPVPDIEDLPEDVRERIETETEDAGFTPNVFPAFAYKPSHFRAFFEYHDALTSSRSSGVSSVSASWYSKKARK